MNQSWKIMYPFWTEIETIIQILFRKKNFPHFKFEIFMTQLTERNNEKKQTKGVDFEDRTQT